MEALGIQAGSPAAKKFIADNETNEEETLLKNPLF